MKDEEKKQLQWHPAFFAGIQIELSEEAEHLIFENEHNLSTKPMQIDVLIIKKNTKEKLKKNIGQIFRKYNIIEYKSPDDYLSIDDFYKVYGYTCFYKADTGEVNEIKTEELTISFVCSHYPRKLIKHLEIVRHMKVEQQDEGIYYIQDQLFQIQLIITTKLQEETNLWLKNLTNDLKENETAEKLIRAYQGHEKNELYSSVMDIIVRANEEKFKEVDKMCEALEEILKDKLEERLEIELEKRVGDELEKRVEVELEKRVEVELEKRVEVELEKREQKGIVIGISKGITQGKQQQLFDLIRKKIAKGKSLEQIADELEETEETILPLYNYLNEEL